ADLVHLSRALAGPEQGSRPVARVQLRRRAEHRTPPEPLPVLRQQRRMWSRLGRNGVFLAWTVGGLAVVTSPTLEGRPGKLIQVGGKAARISVEHSAGGGPSAGGGCQPETTLTVRVETVNHYQLLACTDGNDAQFESDVLAMLRSVSFSAAAGRG